MLWYARVRERRKRAGVAVAGVLLVMCAAVLAVTGAAIGCCSRCNSPLTDENSRALGIGPVCRGRD